MTIRTTLLLLVLLAGCLGEVANEEVGTTTVAALAPVTWTNLDGVTAVENDLTRSASGNDWDAGASSVERFSGDGFVEFSTLENTTGKMVGLSIADRDPWDWSIRYAIHLKADGIVAIRESGDIRDGNVGSYSAGDRFRIQVIGGVVTYWQNGALLYTSNRDSIRSLVVDTSLRTPGATISDAVIETDAFWIGASGAIADGSDLTKTADSGAWNAGARSIESLTVDGYAEFTTGESTSAKMAGLSSGDSDQSSEDIDFAIFLRANGTVAVQEGGVSRGSFGPYAAGDVFRVEVQDGSVTYARNGAVFYTSSGTPSFPLLLDTSLRTAGATIQDASLVEIPGPAIVFENPGGVFVWTPSSYDTFNGFEQGAFLDLTSPADQQTAEPSLAGVEFFKRYSSDLSTPGGFYLRSWRNPDGPPRGASFAAGDDVVLVSPEYGDRVYRAPLVKNPGEAVGSHDRWISGEPAQITAAAGVQTAHFRDAAGDEPPSTAWFQSGIVGVRFRSGGLHYGFVELAWDENGGGERALYVPVRWGYNPVPNQPVIIPP